MERLSCIGPIFTYQEIFGDVDWIEQLNVQDNVDTVTTDSFDAKHDMESYMDCKENKEEKADDESGVTNQILIIKEKSHVAEQYLFHSEEQDYLI